MWKQTTMTASLRSLEVVIKITILQECDLVSDLLSWGPEVSEGRTISGAFTQSFYYHDYHYYDKTRISSKNSTAECVNHNQIFGAQKNDHWMGDP